MMRPTAHWSLGSAVQHCPPQTSNSTSSCYNSANLSQLSALQKKRVADQEENDLSVINFYWRSGNSVESGFGRNRRHRIGMVGDCENARTAFPNRGRVQ